MATIGKKVAHRLMADELRKGEDDIDEGTSENMQKMSVMNHNYYLFWIWRIQNPSIDMVEDAGNEAITLPSTGITRERGVSRIIVN